MGAGTRQPAQDEHTLLLMLAIIHGLARLVGRPEDRADVDLVAREWDHDSTTAAVEADK